MLMNRPRGTNDILPNDSYRWRILENIIHQICAEYGYHEIRTPIFEYTELFSRGVGETTDIVEKEMYSFKDRSDRLITLRPEGTAPTVRAFLEHKMQAQAQPIKMYYLGSMFRYGRPQAGRFRQFHQFGVEAFGSNDPALDAEIISLAMDFYKRLGLKGLTLILNSVGCPECRSQHKQVLQRYLEPSRADLCFTCEGRFDRNPLRIFDCKSEACQQIVAKAPTITDTLCSDCVSHFSSVQQYLSATGTTYQLDPYLVRGLDYYTHTAFEILVDGIGAQSAIGGGGRYNNLVAEIGGPSIPGIGFGLGMERILLALDEQGIKLEGDEQPGIFVAVSGFEAKTEAFKLVSELRRLELKAEMDYLARSLKSQLKYADRHNYQFVVFLGEQELAQQQATVKEMKTGEQNSISLKNITSYLQEKLLKM